MTLSAIVCLYFGYGLAGPRPERFSSWFPFTRKQLQRTKVDLAELAELKLPQHKRRQGLAGLVQFLGMLIFLWLAATGSLLYFLIEPGTKTRGLLHAVEEAHELGAVFLPLYLILHIGAVIAHSLKGNPVWQEIFSFKKNQQLEKASRQEPA
jgi:hypothetical protein